MNYLTGEMKRSLRELDLGLKGELTITSEMEVLENALFLDQVPQVWASRAYPSLLGLTNWFVDLLMRLRELEAWSTDFVVKSLLFIAKRISIIVAYFIFCVFDFLVANMRVVGWIF